MDKDARELNVGIGRTPEIQKGSWGMFLLPDGVPVGYVKVALAKSPDENVTFHIYSLPSDARIVQAQMGKSENAEAFEMMLRGSLTAADNPDKPLSLRKMKRKPNISGSR